MGEASLLIAVCFSGNRHIVVIKCFWLSFEAATSECKIFCVYTVVYTTDESSEEPACLANRMLESPTIRLCSGFHEDNAEFIAWLI